MKKLVLTALLIQLSALVLNAQSLGMSSSLWDVPRTGGELITEPSPEATAMRRYQDLKDGSTLKFNGINVFSSISQKSFSANPDLKLEYNGTMTITQNGTAVRVGLNKPNGENINQLNTSVKCASTFIPLSNLIDKAPIQVKIEAGAINPKVTLLPLPFKMDVTIKY